MPIYYKRYYPREMEEGEASEKSTEEPAASGNEMVARSIIAYAKEEALGQRKALP